MSVSIVAQAHDRFARLREILHDEPGPGVWKALCEALDHWPDEDDLELGLAYADQLLEQRGWPDALRVSPQSWWSRVEGGSRSREGGEPRLKLSRTLRLSLARGDGDRVRRLVPSIQLRHITGIHVIGHGAGDAELSVLVSAPHLPALKTLRLRGTLLSAEGLARLLRSPRLRSLERLELGGNNLGAEEVEAMMRAPLPASLRALELSSNAIGDRGLELLSEMPESVGVVRLMLDWNHIGSSGTAALVGSRFARRLLALDLSHNPIGDQGVAALASSQWCAGLVELSLSFTNLSSSGIAMLAKSPYLRSLKSLDLLGNELDDEAARALAESPGLSQLECLKIGRHRLTRDGLAALATSAYLDPVLVSALTRPVAFLQEYDGPTRGAVYPLYQGSNTLGSDEWGGDWRDLEGAGRSYFTVHCEDGAFALTDLNAPGGVRVNGSVTTMCCLFHGDLLQVGEVQAEFRVIPRCEIRRR